MAGLLEQLGLFGTPPAPRQPQISAPASNSRVQLGTEIYNYFVSRGLAPHQAAAIAGNMAWEGGGRTDLVNPGDNVRNSPNAPHSVGIAQWNDRSPALIAHARSQGIDIPDGDLRDPNYARDVIRRIPLQTQLDFAWSEMQGPEARALEGVRAGSDVRSSTEGAIGYHRPAGWTRANPSAGHGFDNRVSLAEQIMRAGSNAQQPPDAMDTASMTPAPPAAPAPTLTAGTTPPGGQNLLGSLFGPSTPPAVPTTDATKNPHEQLGQMALANMAKMMNEPDGIAAPQMKPLDLTRIRELMQRRGSLGT